MVSKNATTHFTCKHTYSFLLSSDWYGSSIDAVREDVRQY